MDSRQLSCLDLPSRCHYRHAPQYLIINEVFAVEDGILSYDFQNQKTSSIVGMVFLSIPQYFVVRDLLGNGGDSICSLLC